MAPFLVESMVIIQFTYTHDPTQEREYLEQTS